MSLIIGIPACASMVNERPVHLTPARYAAAVMGGTEGLPIMIPPVGPAQRALLRGRPPDLGELLARVGGQRALDVAARALAVGQVDAGRHERGRRPVVRPTIR